MTPLQEKTRKISSTVEKPGTRTLPKHRQAQGSLLHQADRSSYRSGPDQERRIASKSRRTRKDKATTIGVAKNPGPPIGHCSPRAEDAAGATAQLRSARPPRIRGHLRKTFPAFVSAAQDRKQSTATGQPAKVPTQWLEVSKTRASALCSIDRSKW